MAARDYAIYAEDIKKSFGDLKVLKGLTFKVKPGTILALLGPNGAGKTTTIRILSTLIKADGGTAQIEGFDVAEEADDVRSVIGLTGQYAAIDEYLTGKENLKMMGRLYHLSKKDVARRSNDLLKQFDLQDAANRPAKTYSGGMRRRLDLAASLIATPPVIFLDEPTTGLDPRSRLTMWGIITKLVEDGSTILLTTQQLEEADRLADTIAVLDNGKIIAEGTADQLKQKVGKERIELTFRNEAELKKAKQVIGGRNLRMDTLKRTISVPNEGGVNKLKQLLTKLSQAGIEVDGLSLHKPTLDDVFLRLTGHEAKSVAPKKKKRGKK